MASDATVTAETVRPFIARLAGYAPTTEALRHTVQVEYGNMCKLVDQAAAGNFDDPAFQGIGFEVPEDLRKSRFLDVAATRGLLADACRYAMSVADLPEVEVDNEPFQHTSIEALEKARERADNAVGYLLFAVIVPSWRGLLDVQRSEALEVAATRTVLALRCYKAGRGRLPTTLDELTPDYLPRVPVDPYDGKPLRYHAGSGTVYSAAFGNKAPDAAALERAIRSNDKHVFR